MLKCGLQPLSFREVSLKEAGGRTTAALLPSGCDIQTYCAAKLASTQCIVKDLSCCGKQLENERDPLLPSGAYRCSERVELFLHDTCKSWSRYGSVR